MTPSLEERDTLFKAFGRAFFKQDMDAMFQIVTEDFTWTVEDDGVVRELVGKQQIADFFAERKGKNIDVRFTDVVFHHAPDATFMQYRISGKVAATGEPFARVGVERYTFRDGKLAVKDVYARPAPAT
ncbi:MAG: nuclear transport factor 2 family protein [Alphaproteobacteria bacterium]